MSIVAALPTKFILPDLLRMNRHHKQATAESKRWLFRGDNLSQRSRKAIHGLKAGQLTSMCYPDAGFPQLRAGTKSIANVVLNSLHHPYDYYSSARLNRMTKDFYKRMLPTASRGTSRRFIETMNFFFQAVHVQAIDRAKGVIPDLESYISLRRDTSGCKPCWALIEYANNLDIPDEVMEHPIIQSLGEAANDLDIFSYNVEQSKGDTHNMISVVMHEECLDLQCAVDFVGELCKQSIDRFNENRELIPSWGPKIDKDVAIYVGGLADWIVGSLHWSFDTTRYFQNSGREVKRTRVVNLFPRSN
ncbi:isoprenoid synthase domain-containing protein [Suillus subalutaceus]|uniref:isoprenoid synthase domain-containing protein n=1 Tax=Suillus subalutaceus TaxID=48586 RepID=UPI001B878C3D|nr:isoprenoid synthase domain-containing protein [Suillus subalutaceus]KAG1862730.1 isoprenoid synthase domain-containing protein [Suillus subalutaceus]